MTGDGHAEKALRLLRATGGAQMAESMFEGLVAALKPALRPMPDLFWQQFKTRFDPEELMRLIAPRQAEVMTAEDVDAFIAFFESPTGRLYVELLPKLTQIGMEVGREWGERVGFEMARDAG